MIRSIASLHEFDCIPGASTRCFAYYSATKTFLSNMSALNEIDEKDFIINGRLCRSNGYITLNSRNLYGSIVLQSSKTGVRAFFTFERENKTDTGEVASIVYRYFAAENDPLGKNINLRPCIIVIVND